VVRGFDHGAAKKLVAAAQHWVRGGGEFDQARADLAQFGADEASIDAMLGPEEKDFGVWPENWDAMRAFLAVQTQWSTGMGGPTGLDYTRVRSGLELAGVPVTQELFSQLRTLEFAALDAMASNRKRQEKR
jgi:hypothetical protein